MLDRPKSIRQPEGPVSQSDVLLILVLREAGLRSTLSARLSFAGADVITAQGLHDPALTRGARRPAVLVLDEDAIASRSDEWLEALVGDPHWHEVVVLAATASLPPARAGGRLLYLDRATASTGLAAHLPRWGEMVAG